jgi:hypothetical protein
MVMYGGLILENIKSEEVVKTPGRVLSLDNRRPGHEEAQPQPEHQYHYDGIHYSSFHCFFLSFLIIIISLSLAFCTLRPAIRITLPSGITISHGYFSVYAKATTHPSIKQKRNRPKILQVGFTISSPLPK